MKIEYTYKCSRCGKEYKSYNNRLGISKNLFKNIKTVNEYNEYTNYDLCWECYDALKSWLKGIDDEVDDLRRRLEEKSHWCDRYRKENDELEKIKKQFEGCKILCPYEDSSWDWNVWDDYKDWYRRTKGNKDEEYQVRKDN